jgi:hypothetical protein
MAAPNTNPTYQYLDGAMADGTILGVTSTALIGLWGKTPVARYATITTVVNTAPVASSASSAWCYSSSAQALAIITAVNSCIAALQNVGATT